MPVLPPQMMKYALGARARCPRTQVWRYDFEVFHVKGTSAANRPQWPIFTVAVIPAKAKEGHHSRYTAMTVRVWILTFAGMTVVPDCQNLSLTKSKLLRLGKYPHAIH